MESEPAIIPSMDDSTEVPKREHRSFSQFSLFQRCGLAYYYRYKLGWKERPSLALANGKAGHAAVEHNLRRKMKFKEDGPLEEILDVFADHYARETEKLEPGDLDPDQDIGKQKDATVSLLTYYRVKEAPLVTPLMVEAEFALDLPEDELNGIEVPEIVGRIDLVGKRAEVPERDTRRGAKTIEDAWRTELSEVIDHKFVKRAKSQATVDLSDQLTLYDMVMAKTGLPTDRLGLELFIPPTPRNEPKIIQLFRNPEMMTPEVRKIRHDRLLYKMRTIESMIQHGMFVPTDDPVICGYCGFNVMCQESKVDQWTALQIRQSNAGEPAS